MTDPTNSVADLAPTLTLAAPNATTGQAAPPLSRDRYHLGEEIARGGMGEVCRATDTVLSREVAVKVLQAKYPPESPTARRFADEARITAQLQHPNIPAVHDLGTLPDGRPFLAMKLIKGDTLDRLLRERDGTDLARFVPVFEQICHALAYAHAHGVIHRDLKPANVMVGAFNDVQVMDWGLAKVLASGGRQPPGDPTDPDATADPDPTVINSLRDSDDLRTLAGSVLGTPAFMPPEQAVGAVTLIDARSDVFGLGAILAVILTGHPPFTASSTETTRVKAAQGDVAECFARLDRCGAEPELVALCKRCLSPKPADRPANADAVAKAVAALRAAADERARRAEIERENATVQAAEQRKRRRVMQWAGGITAAVLLAGVIGTTAGLLRAEHRRREAEQAKEQEADQRRRADEAEAEALAAYRASTDEAVELLVGSKPALTAQEKAYLEGAVKRWEAFANRAGDDARSRTVRADCHSTLGLLWQKLSRLKEADAEYAVAISHLRALVADYPDPREHQRNLAQTLIRSASVAQTIGKPDAARERLDAAFRTLTQLGEGHPHEAEYRFLLANAHHQLGTLQIETPESDAGADHFRQARDLLRELVDQFPSDPKYPQHLATSHDGLGYYLNNKRRQWPEADAEYRAAIGLLKELVARAPDTPEYQLNLAGCYQSRALVLSRWGKAKEALAEYTLAVDAISRLSERFPAVDEYRRKWAAVRGDRANLLRSTGDYDAAADEFRAVVKTLADLADRNPGVALYQSNLGTCYYNMASLARQRGEIDSAVKLAGKAVDVLTPLHRDQPADTKLGAALQNAHEQRAVWHSEIGMYAEAVADWDRVIELTPEGVFRSIKHVHRVRPLLRAGRLEDALGEVQTLTKPSSVWPPQFWYDFACVCSVAAGKFADKNGEYADAAIEMLQKAVQAKYKDAAHMKTDADLDPLRGREDFKKLLADLEAKFPPKKEVLPPPRADE